MGPITRWAERCRAVAGYRSRGGQRRVNFSSLLAEGSVSFLAVIARLPDRACACARVGGFHHPRPTGCGDILSESPERRHIIPRGPSGALAPSLPSHSRDQGGCDFRATPTPAPHTSRPCGSAVTALNRRPSNEAPRRARQSRIGRDRGPRSPDSQLLNRKAIAGA